MDYRVVINTIETLSELKYQTEILKLSYFIFYKTKLFGNQGVLKKVYKDEVEHLLNRLVRRGILKRGKFLKSSKQIGTFESYFKYLPFDAVEQEELIFESKKHNIEFEEYQNIYKSSSTSPYGTSTTNDGDITLKK